MHACVFTLISTSRAHARAHTHTHTHTSAQTGATVAGANAHGQGGTPVRIALKPAERVTFRVDSSLLLRTLALDWTHCSVCCLLAHTRRARRHACPLHPQGKGSVDLDKWFFFEPCLFVSFLLLEVAKTRLLSYILKYNSIPGLPEEIK